MKCNYCSKASTGINYRPQKGMNNHLSCLQHAGNLYIAFATNQENHQRKRNKIQIQNKQKGPEQIFSRLINTITAQLNNLKSQVIANYKQNLTLTPQKALSYEMQCQFSNPYMVINNDEEMMVSALLNQIKNRYEVRKIAKMRQSFMSDRLSIWEFPQEKQRRKGLTTMASSAIIEPTEKNIQTQKTARKESQHRTNSEKQLNTKVKLRPKQIITQFLE